MYAGWAVDFASACGAHLDREWSGSGFSTNIAQRRRRAYLGDEHRGGHALDIKANLRLSKLGVLPDSFELAF